MNGNERFTPQDFDPETAPDLSAGEWPAKFARARVRRGRPPLATPKVSTTIRLSPDVLAHFKAGGRGWQTRINAALREWIRTYTKAIELNPTYAAAYNNRGTAKDDLGQPEAAIADYDRAIAKDENMSQDVAEIEMKVIPKDEWDEKVAVVRQKGERFAREMRLQGKRFKAAILGPREFPPGADVAMQAVVIQRDWKAAAKLEMVEDANNFLTKARQIDIFHPDLLGALKSVLQEEPLPMHSIGEFFILYGRFEQKYRLSKSKEIIEKMEELMKGGKVHLKEYDKNKKYPLPYAARNILAHIGTNPNTLLVKELNLAKNLLEDWLRP